MLFFSCQVSGQIIEVRTPITHRDYSNLISQEDPNHFLVLKTRRCFLFKNQYFQLDIYREPCHERCKVKAMTRQFSIFFLSLLLSLAINSIFHGYKICLYLKSKVYESSSQTSFVLIIARHNERWGHLIRYLRTDRSAP